MKIIVLVKQVPESSAVKMDEATGTVVRAGADMVVNPLDLYGVKAALDEKVCSGAETLALSMGPRQAETALREVMSLGIDSAALVSDRAFAGADTWSTAFILASAAKFLGGADLYLCGERATDGDTGQVGPEFASALGLPVVTYVRKIAARKPGVLTVLRAEGHGTETLEVRLPAVVSILKENGDPGLPTLDGKIRAKAAPVKIITQKELNLPPEMTGLAGSPTRVVKIFHPKVGRTCRMVRASAGTIEPAAAEFTAFLHEKNIL